MKQLRNMREYATKTNHLYQLAIGLGMLICLMGCAKEDTGPDDDSYFVRFNENGRAVNASTEVAGVMQYEDGDYMLVVVGSHNESQGIVIAVTAKQPLEEKTYDNRTLEEHNQQDGLEYVWLFYAVGDDNTFHNVPFGPATVEIMEITSQGVRGKFSGSVMNGSAGKTVTSGEFFAPLLSENELNSLNLSYPSVYRFMEAQMQKDAETAIPD